MNNATSGLYNCAAMARFAYTLLLAFVVTSVCSSSYAETTAAPSTPSTATNAEQNNTLASASTRRVQRAMKVNQVVDLGLEVWTEQQPAWIVATREIEGQPVLLAQSPPQVYPPASMSVTAFAKVHAEIDNFKRTAEVAIKRGLTQYGVPGNVQNRISREKKQYGELDGIEVNFTAEVHGSAADVKVFIGTADNKGHVLLQLYTIQGGMAHLQEQIRRSWGNIKFL